MTALFAYLILAVGISFLCSIIEAVLLSTPISFITMKIESGDKRAVLMKSYKQNTDKPLSAILSLNTIAHTIGAAGVGAQVSIVFGDQYLGIASIIVTLIILVTSEIIPKTIGTNYWKSLAMPVTVVIRYMIWIMYPLVILSQWITKIFSPAEPDPGVSREEVSAMVNVGVEEGVFEEDESEIIQNLITFDDYLASDIMTPRVVASIASESQTVKEYFNKRAREQKSGDKVAKLHHSRIPVYSDNDEFITGYVLRHEILEHLAYDRFDVKLAELKRECLYFSENTPVPDILNKMLEEKEQLVIIINEFGCFQGLITMEDIMETLLGLEILDEKDEIPDLAQYAKERWEKRAKKSPDQIFTEQEEH